MRHWWMLLLAGCGRSVLVEPGALGAGGASANAANAANATAAGPNGSTASQGSGAGPAATGSSATGTSATGIAVTIGSVGSMTSATTDAASATASTGSGMTCGAFGDACTNCIASQCSATWCSCVGDPQCLPLLQCFSKCGGDAACNQQCMTDHKDGIADVLLVSNCAGGPCNGACGWGSPGDPCQTCVFDSCKQETNDCFGDASCAGLWQCLNACPPIKLTCQSACYKQYPTGIDPLQAWIDCTAKNCSAQCPGQM